MMKTEENVIEGYPPIVPLSHISLGQFIYNGLINKNKAQEKALIDVSTKTFITYDDIIKKTTRLAYSLWKCGYHKGSVFSISSENNVSYFYPVIAALYIGAITAPDELIHALNISKSKIIFCSSKCIEKILKVKQKLDFIESIIVTDANVTLNINGIDSLDGFIEKNCENTFNPLSFKPISLDVENDAAFIMCSSGTTGLAKGVVTTHKNIHVRLAQLKDSRITTQRDKDTFLCIVPFFHAYGFIVSLGYITDGHMIVTMNRFDENLFLQSIQDFGIKSLWLVPPIVILLAKSPRLQNYDLSSVEEIICGAAPLSKETELACVKRFKNVKRIRQAYGMTEATLAVTMTPTNEFKPGSSGKVVSYMAMKICDPETRKTLGRNEIGEICIKGPLVMKGYYGNDDETRKIIDEDGWLHSGDLGYFDNDGYLFVVDRLKELIKYKGFQVPPAEIEALLLKHPKIKDVGVVGLPNEEAGELPFAFVVKAPGAILTENEIKDFVAERVSSEKILRGGVAFLDAIPKNPSGKILRRELKILLKKPKTKL